LVENGADEEQWSLDDMLILLGFYEENLLLRRRPALTTFHHYRSKICTCPPNNTERRGQGQGQGFMEDEEDKI
jgi:hypothetical protein